MNAKLCLCAAALLAPYLAGCGGSSSSSNVNTPITSSPVPRSVSAALSNGLTATLTEDRSIVAVGGTMTYTAALTNSTAQPITYQPVLSGTSSFSVPASLVIKDSSGQIIYPVGPVAAFVGIGASVTLAPGQSVSRTLAVSTTRIAGLTITQGYAAAGQYTATASFAIIPGTAPSTAQLTTVDVGPLPVTAQ